MKSITGWVILVLVAVPCLKAGRISTVTASTNMGSNFGTNIQNTVNGVGLSSLILAATHDMTSPANSWVSGAGILTGIVTFDLGGTFLVDSFSFWNQNGGGPGAGGITGINGVAVSTSMDGITFNSLLGGPTTFAQVPGTVNLPPQIFNFTPVLASRFQFTILSNYGDLSDTGFAEVAFDSTVSAVPEPSTITIVSLGLLLGLFGSRLRCQRSKSNPHV